MTADERAYDVVRQWENGKPWQLSDITDAIRAAEDAMRERCAQVAEGLPFEDWDMDDGTRRRCAEAIRATGSVAALHSAAALFGGVAVPPGEPTIADALTCGSKVLRDLATGSGATHDAEASGGPWCNGLWLYRHTDGRPYVCRATDGGSELTWFDALPQGDWDDAGWVLLEETGSGAADNGGES